jgi:hypothetical protein
MSSDGLAGGGPDTQRRPAKLVIGEGAGFETDRQDRAADTATSEPAGHGFDLPLGASTRRCGRTRCSSARQTRRASKSRWRQ